MTSQDQLLPIATPLKKTPLNAAHRALKARMVDFGGWDMPVEYPGQGGGLIAEHMAVRSGVGLFDVSHMGEIQFRGPGALAALQQITMNDASRLSDGQAHYSALLTPEGTYVDDILVHRLSQNDYLLVVNAGTKDKDYAWIRKQVGGLGGIHISDYSDYYAQISVQGPRGVDQCVRGRAGALAQARKGWVHWPRGIAGGSSRRRAETQACGAGDGGARYRSRWVRRTVFGWRRDWHSHFRLTRALFEDEHCLCAGASDGCCQRRGHAGAGARESSASKTGSGTVLQAGEAELGECGRFWLKAKVWRIEIERFRSIK